MSSSSPAFWSGDLDTKGIFLGQRNRAGEMAVVHVHVQASECGYICKSLIDDAEQSVRTLLAALQWGEARARDNNIPIRGGGSNAWIRT